MEKVNYFKDHEKRRQITFRISETAQERLQKAASLFNMKPTEYAKAVIYRDLGVFDEPLDKRRRRYKEKQRHQEREDEKMFAEDIETTDEEESLQK
jgi:hypothetical protein